MNTQLTASEIQEIQQLLKDEPAQKALSTLEQNNGNLEASFDILWQEQFGIQEYGKGKSLLQLVLDEIRAEICGDEGLRGKPKEYTNNPGSASLLNSIIGSLVTVAALNGIPIDGAIATIIVLYILKIGLNVFCKYTKPEGEEEKK
ncbi:hypothetical protein SAMD00079811_49590 [Scytonema sp. HK-05]|uniref:hypothetical protein n=1 Tax=Scytonema sp. HK-05 TaxID=1137095 RepID=UPI0009358076|nr:hypothetical protein [Scytonema sp. HK-05]OKH52640.1 hypothetical protein NIES2130_31705 [Scytonema sp. HK-05]BAY47341.1 hypothetical protein SAMD00079811_49590 [Scytonema sp. HK-05]